jgi:hypothetical protein
VQGLLNISRAGIELRRGAREARAVVETGGGKFIESGPLVIP